MLLKTGFLVFLLGGFLLTLGCLEQASPKPTPFVVSISPTPIPTIRPTPTVKPCFTEGQSLGAVVPANLNNKCCPGLEPFVPAGMVGTMGTCVKPTPVPTTPTLSQFARQLEPVFAAVFNKTKAARLISSDPEQWLLDDLNSGYRVEIYVEKSKTSGWTSFEVPTTVKNPDGTKSIQAVVYTDSKNAYFSTEATFKCFNWAYGINVKLQDYAVNADGSFKQALGKSLASHLVDACPA